MFNNFVKAIETAIKNGDEIIVTHETKDLGSMYLCLVPDLVEEEEGLIMILSGKSTIAVDTKLNTLEFDETENAYIVIGSCSVITVSF